MLLERRTVSRKTPGDGRLEVSRVTEDAVRALGRAPTVRWRGREAPASIARMSCTCAKGGGQHEHVFLESDLFRALDAGSEVDLTLDEATARLSVTPAR